MHAVLCTWQHTQPVQHSAACRGRLGGCRFAATVLPSQATPHVRAPLLQFEPAVDHRAYARVLMEALRCGNHSLAKVLIGGASLDTLLMSDTQGRGFLHALGR